MGEAEAGRGPGQPYPPGDALAHEPGSHAASRFSRARRRLGRIQLLQPLKLRDFSLLWSGMTISMLGDGVYFVAIAWQVLRISNSPAALSAVGVAWGAPPKVFPPLGGGVKRRGGPRAG